MMKVVAAALRTPTGEIVSLPQPARHHDIIRHMIVNLGFLHTHDCQQGFVSDCGKWLRRKPAAHIAIKANQVDILKWPPNLYSEDLW